MANLAVVYSRDEGTRGWDLKDGVDRPLKVLSEGRGDDG
jgi:hypothetical protein